MLHNNVSVELDWRLAQPFEGPAGSLRGNYIRSNPKIYPQYLQRHNFLATRVNTLLRTLHEEIILPSVNAFKNAYDNLMKSEL